MKNGWERVDEPNGPNESNGSISSLQIDNVQQFVAALEPRQVLRKQVDYRIEVTVAKARSMGRNDHVRQ